MSAEERGEMWPAVKIYEDAGNLLIEADVPGVSPEDLSIDVESTKLVLEGWRPSRPGHDTRGPERFYRLVPLPFTVNPMAAEAQLASGVLQLKIARADDERRRIPLDTRHNTRR
jgi:HSP20 family protein